MPSIVIPASSMKGIAEVIRELAALNDAELLNLLNENLNDTVNSHSECDLHKLFNQFTGL